MKWSLGTWHCIQTRLKNIYENASEEKPSKDANNKSAEKTDLSNDIEYEEIDLTEDDIEHLLVDVANILLPLRFSDEEQKHVAGDIL